MSIFIPAHSIRLILGLATSLLILSGCQTSEKAPTKLLSPEEVNPFELKEFEFESDEVTSIYNTLLKAELASGVNINLNTLHSVKGVVQCFFDGVGFDCQLRAELPNSPYYSDKSNLPREFSQRVSLHYKKRRGDLLKDRIVSANINCDFSGKGLPSAGGSENTVCVMHHPRRVSEVIFSGHEANNLRDALSKAFQVDGISPKLVDEFRGFIQCNFHNNKTKSVCIVRTKDQLLRIQQAKNKAKTLPANKKTKTAKDKLKNRKGPKPPAKPTGIHVENSRIAEISRVLLRGYGEYRLSKNNKRKSNNRDPEEITARLRCLPQTGTKASCLVAF